MPGSGALVCNGVRPLLRLIELFFVQVVEEVFSPKALA